MKNILKITTLLLLLSSCEPNITKIVEGENNGIITVKSGPLQSEIEIKEFDYKGHTYIYTYVHNGVSSTHAGHCKCNDKQDGY